MLGSQCLRKIFCSCNITLGMVLYVAKIIQVVQEQKDDPFLIHGFSLKNQWIYPGLHLEYPWIISGLSQGYPSIILGSSLDYPWIILWLYWDFPWIRQAFPLNFPQDCPWSTPGLSVDYLWIRDVSGFLSQVSKKERENYCYLNGFFVKLHSNLQTQLNFSWFE